MFKYFKNCKPFSEEAVPFTFPTAANECFSFSMSPAPGVNSLSNVGLSRRCTVVPHCDLNLHFLNDE